MKNIAVIGYGVIGKRVADAINLQEDMKLTGEIPSHQGPDAQSVDPDLDVITSAVKVPETLGHLHYWTVKLKRSVSKDEVLQAFRRDKTSYYLDHVCEKITKERLQFPGEVFVDRVFVNSNRNPQTLRSLAQLYNHGTLKGTGYLSILPVDQGIEHSAAFSFYKNPDYFDPENIVKLAMEGGCKAVASTFGVLGQFARKYAHKIPFIVKINHNELLAYPNKYDQTWCYLRNDAFKTDQNDYHEAADLTGQANHLGVTIQADIIKQKVQV